LYDSPIIQGANNFYSSSNIIRMIKSRTIKWGGHVAHMEQKKSAYEGLVGTPEGKRQTDLNINGRMILKRILGL
jgi:hypothetical protein